MKATELFPTPILYTADRQQISLEKIQEWIDQQKGCSMSRGGYDQLCDPSWAKDYERVTLFPLNAKGYQVGMKPWTIYMPTGLTRAA